MFNSLLLPGNHRLSALPGKRLTGAAVNNLLCSSAPASLVFFFFCSCKMRVLPDSCPAQQSILGERGCKHSNMERVSVPGDERRAGLSPTKPAGECVIGGRQR